MEKITFVIPSRNNLEFLQLAYKSIRNLETKHEILVLNDASIDGTQEWVDNALKVRAKRAKDDILLLNMKHCNANGIVIADTEDKQVEQAFTLKVVKTAKERDEEAKKLPEQDKL